MTQRTIAPAAIRSAPRSCRSDAGAALLLAALAVSMLFGCTAGAPTPQAQRVIDVLCVGDALAQPVVVPVVVAVVPAASPAATIDTLLVHPAVVAACARYASRPAALVPAGPAGATVAPAVTIAAAPEPAAN